MDDTLPRVRNVACLLRVLYNKDRHGASPVTTLGRTRAHLFEVVAAAEVLGDCHAVLEIEYRVPPATRHEHGVTRVLNEFVNLDRVAILASYPRQEVHEVVDLQTRSDRRIITA